MIFADVIFPVFTVPYLLALGAPWAIVIALLAEILVFWLRGVQLGFWTIIAGTLGANAFSWFLGILIFMSLPIPYIGVSQDKNFQVHYSSYYVALAFFIAFVLSTLLEYLVWSGISFKRGLPSLFGSTLLANIASYTVLIIAALIIDHFSLAS